MYPKYLAWNTFEYDTCFEKLWIKAKGVEMSRSRILILTLTLWISLMMCPC